MKKSEVKKVVFMVLQKRFYEEIGTILKSAKATEKKRGEMAGIKDFQNSLRKLYQEIDQLKVRAPDQWRIYQKIRADFDKTLEAA